MSKSKDDIIEEFMPDHEYSIKSDAFQCYNQNKIGRMMEEWAQFQSIAFAEWCQESGWEKHIGESSWRNRMGYVTEYSTEQLYNQFLASL